MFCRARQVVPRLNRQICCLQSKQVRNLSDRRRNDWEDFWNNKERNHTKGDFWNNKERNHTKGDFWKKLLPKTYQELETRFTEIGKDLEKNVAPRFAYYAEHGRFPGKLKLQDAIEVECDNKAYTIKMEVTDYTPEQLKIKIIEDKLIVYGKHEQKEDAHGLISREFQREFLIPETVDQDTITTLVSEEGVLVVHGDIKAEFGKTGGRTIGIERPES